MYDYGSPEKNKEHYGNVSVNVLIADISLLAALILLCFYQAGSVSENILVLVIVALLRYNFLVGFNSRDLIL